MAGITIEKVLEIVFSSKREKPAYFNLYKSREHRFGIEFEALNSEDEAHLALQAYKHVGMFKTSFPDLSNEGIEVLLRYGENIMLGTYILNKTGHQILTTPLQKAIKDRTTEFYVGKPPERVLTLLKTGDIHFILDYYRYLGEQIAEGNPTNFIEVFHHERRV